MQRAHRGPACLGALPLICQAFFLTPLLTYSGLWLTKRHRGSSSLQLHFVVQMESLDQQETSNLSPDRSRFSFSYCSFCPKIYHLTPQANKTDFLFEFYIPYTVQCPVTKTHLYANFIQCSSFPSTLTSLQFMPCFTVALRLTIHFIIVSRFY